MPTGPLRLAAMAWLLFGQAAAACDTADGKADESPLHTRKPVLGEEVWLTSGFGMRLHPLLNVRRMHAGIDWAAPPGTPVIAAAGGRVVSARASGEYGWAVIIDHGAGWRTLYAHLSAFDVREGDCVAALAVIGKSGATGLSTGPKLHFEVHRNGQAIDPLRLPASGAPADGDSK
jgi:murein DD-endopeptidase MepM/ murein hydrolase activator NlpD